MSHINPPNVAESSPPPILALPNEILQYILNFLSNGPYGYSPSVQYISKCKKHTVSQMLVLRSVCRHFRYITADLDFWYKPDFLFAYLVSNTSKKAFGGRKIGTRFLEDVIFPDTNLINSLGRRKTEWLFQSVEDLSDVMHGVPLFKKNVQGIRLDFREEVDTAIDMLATCSYITTLCIDWGCIGWRGSVNLSAIASSFPFLRTLSCPEARHFYGSLKQLSGLWALNMGIRNMDIRNIDPPPTIQPWLPLRSTQTLIKLSLRCRYDHVPISFFDLNSLYEFINLKYLQIEPLNPSICDFLLRSRCQLHVFELILHRPLAPIDIVISMFQASCLRTVKKFSISRSKSSSFDPDYPRYGLSDTEMHAGDDYWPLVFDAFTAMLTSVEEVQLVVPLHLDSCDLFTRMTNLKLLNWVGEQPCMSFGYDPKAEVEKALEKAFGGFVEKPRFSVKFNGW